MCGSPVPDNRRNVSDVLYIQLSKCSRESKYKTLAITKEKWGQNMTFFENFFSKILISAFYTNKISLYRILISNSVKACFLFYHRLFGSMRIIFLFNFSAYFIVLAVPLLLPFHTAITYCDLSAIYLLVVSQKSW